MHGRDVDDLAFHPGQGSDAFEVDGAVWQQSDAVADRQSRRPGRGRSRLHLHGALLLIDSVVRDCLANVVPSIDERMINGLLEA